MEDNRGRYPAEAELEFDAAVDEFFELYEIDHDE